MLKPHILALALFIVPVAAQSRFTVEKDDTITRSFPLDRGRSLEVANISGSINVTGVDGRSVELKARRNIRAETDADARDAESRSTLESKDSASGLAIATEPGRRFYCDDEMNEGRGRRDRDRYRVTVDLDLTVPRGTSLTLCTINGAAIQIDGVQGPFDAEKVNGSIVVKGARGAARASTVNGGVMVSFDENPKTPARFKTVNGDINVSFQRDLSADLKLKTMHGGLYTDFEVVNLPRTVSTSRRNGMFVYKSDDAALVRVAKGGPEMTFETLNGSVRVLRRDN